MLCCKKQLLSQNLEKRSFYYDVKKKTPWNLRILWMHVLLFQFSSIASYL